MTLLVLGWRRGVGVPAAFAWCWAWPGIAGALLVADRTTPRGFPLPPQQESFVACGFERALSATDYSMRISYGGRTAYMRGRPNYQTAFAWTQRVGWVPSVVGEIGSALSEYDVLVSINPKRAPIPAQREAIRAYVEQGGKLLVMVGEDRPPGPRRRAKGTAPPAAPAEARDRLLRERAANALLEPYGLCVDLSPHASRALLTCGLEGPAWPAFYPCTVKGGRALLKRMDDKPVLAVTECGRGRVAVFGDSHVFTSANMGSIFETPTPMQVRVAQLLYYLCRDVTLGEPEQPDRRLADGPN